MKLIGSTRILRAVVLTSGLASSWAIDGIAQEIPVAGMDAATELRDELLARIEKDQDARFAAIAWNADHGVDGIVDTSSLTDEEKVQQAQLQTEIASIDAENTAWLKQITTERGWPTYSEVGTDAADAAWLLVQHADAYPEFQRLCLDLMTELPANEVSQINVAMLTDRVRVAAGKPQLYGSQFNLRNGEWVPLDIEDEANVDARREAIGLPPMSEYKAMLEAVMRGEEVE